MRLYTTMVFECGQSYRNGAIKEILRNFFYCSFVFKRERKGSIR